MRKSIFMTAAVLLVAFAMGCGGSETPASQSTATLTPETQQEEQSACEKNGHTWVDATCTEAKTCSVCGETDGEPLGHVANEATYQEASVCSVCNEVVAERLKTWVEEGGYTYKGEEGVKYSVTARCPKCPEDTEPNYSYSIMFNGIEYVGEEWHSDDLKYDRYQYSCSVYGVNMEAQEYKCGHYTYPPCSIYGVSMYEKKKITWQNSEDVVIRYNNKNYKYCMTTGSGVDTEYFSDGWKSTVCIDIPAGYDGMLLCIVPDYNECKSAEDTLENAIIVLPIEH